MGNEGEDLVIGLFYLSVCILVAIGLSLAGWLEVL